MDFNNLEERKKIFYRTATHKEMDQVQILAMTLIKIQPTLTRQSADSLALQLFLINNPDRFQSGGKYKKHKTLKRKHSSKSSKKNHNRTRYHRKK